MFKMKLFKIFDLSTKGLVLTILISLIFTFQVEAKVDYDQIYERVPEDGARLSFVDTDGDFIDHFMDLDPHPVNMRSQSSFIKGTMFLFGDGQQEHNNDDSFDDIWLKLGTDYFDSALGPDYGKAEFGAVGLVTRDTSNPANPIYDVYLYCSTVNAIGGCSAQTGYLYTETIKAPTLKPSTIRSILEEAEVNGAVTTHDIEYEGYDQTVRFNGILRNKINQTHQQIGDPDVLHKFVDDVWVYLKDNVNEYVFHVNVDLGEANQNIQTIPADNLRVSTRGNVIRVQFTPPFDNQAAQVSVEAASGQGNPGYVPESDPGVLWDDDYEKYYGVSCEDGTAWCDPDLITDDDSGIVSYLVEIEGEHDLDFDSDIDKEAEKIECTNVGPSGCMRRINGTTYEVEYPYKWLSKNPVLFLRAENDERYKINVYTMNSEGSLSQEISKDMWGANSWKADLVKIEEELSDLNREDPDQYYFDEVQYLYKLGIIDGYTDGTYKPYETVNRAQLAKFIMNAFRIPFDVGGERFPDVPEDNVFFPYIQSLKNAGIINGYSSGTYYDPGVQSDEAVEKPVDRGQTAKFIFNAANYFDLQSIAPGGFNCFDDMENNGDVNDFAEYICGLADYHSNDYIQDILTHNGNEGYYEPESNLFRADMAVFILNAIASIPPDSSDPDRSFIHKYWYLYTDADKADTTGGPYGTNPYVYFSTTTNAIPASVKSFIRPFVQPVKVTDFDAGNTDYDKVNLTWDNITGEGSSIGDLSVDGYIIEKRKAEGYEKDDPAGYKPVDIEDENGTDIRPSAQISISGSTTATASIVEADITVDELSTSTISFSGGAARTSTDIGQALESFIENSGNFTTSSPSFDVVPNTDSTVLTVYYNGHNHDKNGAVLDFSDLQAQFDASGGSTVQISTSNFASGMQKNDEGIILAPARQFVDYDVKDEVGYDYRIRAFKFIPYEYAEKEFRGDYLPSDSKTLQNKSNYDERENMILGPTECDSAITDVEP